MEQKAKLAAAARLANMTMEQLSEYESDMRTEIDRWAEISFAKEQGLAQGLAEGRAEAAAEKQKIAKAFLAKGFDVHDVSDCTGLSVEDVEALRQ